MGQHYMEIRIQGDQNIAVLSGEPENLFIIGCREIYVRDMNA